MIMAYHLARWSSELVNLAMMTTSIKENERDGSSDVFGINRSKARILGKRHGQRLIVSDLIRMQQEQIDIGRSANNAVEGGITRHVLLQAFELLRKRVLRLVGVDGREHQIKIDVSLLAISQIKT